MDAPEKLRAIDFLIEREKWIRAHIQDGCCRHCGSTIQFVQAFISVHDNRFVECVGNGQVVRVAVPYCSYCEDSVPKTAGCFHDDVSVSVRSTRN